MKKASPAKKKGIPTKTKSSAKGVSLVKKVLPWALIAVAVLAIGVLLLKPGAKGGGGIRDVDSAGLLEAQKNGAEVIDVRTAEEYKAGHIEGSVNVPIGQLQRLAASWDRNEDYVLCDATGKQSLEGQKEMEALGFKNVANLAKGISSWTGPLEKGQTTSQQNISTSGAPLMIEFFTPT